MGEKLAGDPAPYFASHVFVCINRRPDGHAKGSCAERGSEKLRDYIKLRAKALGIPRVRINGAACLDRCELGPVIVVYPEGVWYRIRNKFEADAVLEKHLLDGSRATGLMLPP